MTYKLSILIPAYNYADGVLRILERLGNYNHNQVEVIISDDSTNCELNDLIKHEYPDLKYIRNEPSLGPVFNWNQLLRKASGDYIWLVHHDEFPMENDFVEKLLDVIQSQPNVDVFVLKLNVINTMRFRRVFLNNQFRIFLINFFPTYLFFRNFIGPVSSLVFNRLVSDDFNTSLKWFVDIEFYMRMRKRTKKWILSNKLYISSEANRSLSITSSLKHEINYVKSHEYEILTCNYTYVYWLFMNPLFKSFFYFLDFLFWYSLKSISYLFNDKK